MKIKDQTSFSLQRTYTQPSAFCMKNGSVRLSGMENHAIVHLPRSCDKNTHKTFNNNASNELYIYCCGDNVKPYCYFLCWHKSIITCSLYLPNGERVRGREIENEREKERSGQMRQIRTEKCKIFVRMIQTTRYQNRWYVWKKKMMKKMTQKQINAYHVFCIHRNSFFNVDAVFTLI